MDFAYRVETLGVDLRTRSKQLEAKEKEQVRREVFHSEEESRFSEDLHDDWCEKIVEDRLGLCESVVRTSGGY